LNESGELRFVPRTPGKHQYAWNRPATPVLLTRDIVDMLHQNTIEREAAAADTEPEPPPARRVRRRTVARRRSAR